MAELTLLKWRGAEEPHSPELRYTFDRLVAEARATFGEVEVRIFSADEEAPALESVESDWILTVGTPCILATRRTLGVLKEALVEDREALAAVPARLSATDLPGRFPLYTLRGFERAEAAWLAEAASPTPLPVAEEPAPLALVRRDRVRGERLSLTALQGSGKRILQAGLCHVFSDYYGEPRRDVLPHLPENLRDVLEIGCGRGVTGALIQKEHACRVVGVELNPQVAREAETRLDQVLVGDVLQLEDNIRSAGPFDLVLALELFEHLTDGEAFLQRARRWLRPGGSILLSVPNVGHFSIVEDLIAGRWDYLPQGLLCYTHYRFFTRATLGDWLHRCGFKRFEIVAQKTSLPEELPLHLEGGGLSPDRESLATAGFYVRIEV